MDNCVRAIMLVAVRGFEMSARGRVEFCRPQGNVTYPAAFSDGDRLGVRAPRNAGEIAYDQLADPRITVRVSLRDSILMVGG